MIFYCLLGADALLLLGLEGIMNLATRADGPRFGDKVTSARNCFPDPGGTTALRFRP